MKIFFYKTIFIFILIYILIELTFIYQIKNFEKKLLSYISKDNIPLIKQKILKEIDYLSRQDRILEPNVANKIKIIIDKLKFELSF